jgi:2,3-bisphosphoglycerate-dependent phosphoglycerate mutase
MGTPMKMDETCFHIFLLRHGRSLGNENGFLQGQQDIPLTDDGRSQAQLLAERWFADDIHFDLILTSPLSRASETAGIIAAKLGCPVEKDALLMERNVGSLSGAPVGKDEQLIDQRLMASPYRSLDGDGEGDWELFLRAGQVLLNLMKRELGNYLIVSHGGLLNQLTHAILGLPPQARYKGVGFKLDNTGFSHFVYFLEEHHWNVITINNVDHLRPRAAE